MSEDKSYEKVKSPATKKKSPKKAVEKSEEASAAAKTVRANRRSTRRHTAHVPGPRRKPTLAASASQWKAEEESVAEAPAEAEDSDEGDAFS